MSICDFIGTTIRSILYSTVGVFAIGMQAFARTITVYNYRVKLRNAAVCGNDEFEKRLMEIN